MVVTKAAATLPVGSFGDAAFICAVDDFLEAGDDAIDITSKCHVHSRGCLNIYLVTIPQAIIKYRSVDRIKNLTFLTKLKCGIGKTKLPELVDRLVY
jgi:hypothetical protein